MAIVHGKRYSLQDRVVHSAFKNQIGDVFCLVPFYGAVVSSSGFKDCIKSFAVFVKADLFRHRRKRIFPEPPLFQPGFLHYTQLIDISGGRKVAPRRFIDEKIYYSSFFYNFTSVSVRRNRTVVFRF